MSRITIDAYSDIYSDLYGTAGVILSVEIAFTTDPADTPIWENVSQYVRSFETHVGRNDELDTFSPGRATVVLDNRDRRFDPTYTSSPYYPYVVPMRRLRVAVNWQGTDYPLFSGYIDAWPQEYRMPHDGYSTVTATDAFKVFASIPLPSVYEQEIRQDAPVLWARLGEPGGTVAYDSSGNGNDGEYSDSPSFGETGALIAEDDGAVNFQAIVTSTGSSAAARASFPPMIDGTGDFSVEFWWFNPNGYNAGPFVVLHQGPTTTGTAAGTASGWAFWASQTVATDFVTVTITNHINFRVYQTPGVFTTASYSYAYTYPDGATEATDPYANKWRHIVGTRSGVDVTLYVDGALGDTSAGAGTWDIPGIDNVVCVPGNGATTIGSTLDELAIYDSALSEDRALAHYNAARDPWVNDSTGTRIQRVLDYIGWSGSSDIDTGQGQLQRAELGNGALQHMQDVELTEVGRFFIDGSGVPTFIERHAVISQPTYATSQATFGDGPGELKYADITFDYSDQHIRNDIRVTSPSLQAQTAVDSASQASYLPKGYERAVLESSPARMKDIAQYILGRYKDPLLRVTSIQVKPQREESTLYPQVLGRQLGERITVKRRPQAIGDPISQEVHIESISHQVDISAQVWLTTWELSPAETRAYWVLDSSRLDTGTRLAV